MSGKDPEAVGIRELRQNLSVYLRRVAEGERFTVTDRGHAVASLGPLPEHARSLDRLVAAGRAVPPTGDLLAVGPPPGPDTDDLSRALQEEREERTPSA